MDLPYGSRCPAEQQGIHKLIVIGLIASTCVESTVGFGAELGYQVALVKHATASRSMDEMHASIDINIPKFATTVVTTDELVNPFLQFGRAHETA